MGEAMADANIMVDVLTTDADRIAALTAERDALAAQVATLHGNQPTLCVECGPSVDVDEDGCCRNCGATAVGTWLSKWWERNAAAAAAHDNAIRRETLERAVEIAEQVVRTWSRGNKIYAAAAREVVTRLRKELDKPQ